MDPRLTHIRDWIFDLDNCLYPASTGLFALIDERMGAYIQRLLGCDPVEAKTVQKKHFHEHGTTLAGLMKEHGVDPHDFLEDVHDIPLDRVQCDERLGNACPACRAAALSSPTAMRLMPAASSRRSGSSDHFEDLHDVHATGYRPKPDPHGYELLCERFGIDPAHALLADDMVQNLVPAKALGMTTVWVDNGSERGDHGFAEGVDRLSGRDLGDWLERCLGDENERQAAGRDRAGLGGARFDRPRHQGRSSPRGRRRDLRAR